MSAQRNLLNYSITASDALDLISTPTQAVALARLLFNQEAGTRGRGGASDVLLAAGFRPDEVEAKLAEF